MRRLTIVSLIVAGIVVSLALAMLHPADSTDVARSERARSAAQFVDSIGVNVHFSYRDTGYGNRARVVQLLDGLGVRHLRDGVTLGQLDVCAIDRALAQKNYRFTFITPVGPTADMLRAWASCTGLAAEAFEGLNEYDASHPASDTQWASTVRSSQRALYRSVKQSSQLSTLPVVAPSFTSEASFRSVGDLSNDVDVANMHNYFSFHEPETKGWGINGYGSIAYNMDLARSIDASKPISATETGYGTDRSSSTVDAVTQAVYLPRLLLEQFASGVTRTFSYELIDEGPAPYSHYGIIDQNLAPKPAYTALASLIASLRDTSAAYHTGELAFTIGGGQDNLHHLLLQKRDGRFILALWIGAPSCDPVSHAAVDVAPQHISVSFGEAVRSAAVSQFGSDWRLHPTDIAFRTPLTLTVTDRVTLLEIVPAIT